MIPTLMLLLIIVSKAVGTSMERAGHGIPYEQTTANVPLSNHVVRCWELQRDFGSPNSSWSISLSRNPTEFLRQHRGPGYHPDNALSARELLLNLVAELGFSLDCSHRIPKPTVSDPVEAADAPYIRRVLADEPQLLKEMQQVHAGIKATAGCTMMTDSKSQLERIWEELLDMYVKVVAIYRATSSASDDPCRFSYRLTLPHLLKHSVLPFVRYVHKQYKVYGRLHVAGLHDRIRVEQHAIRDREHSLLETYPNLSHDDALRVALYDAFLRLFQKWSHATCLMGTTGPTSVTSDRGVIEYTNCCSEIKVRNITCSVNGHSAR